MDVLAGAESGKQPRVTRKVGHDAQLDLRIVGGKNLPAGRCHKGLADAPAFLGAHRDVLQVGIRRGKPPGGRGGLVVAGVYPSRARIDDLGQFLGIGRTQFGQTSIFEDQARQFMFIGNRLQRLFVGRGLALGCFQHRRQLQLVKQKGLELLGRIEAERMPGQRVALFGQLLHARRQLSSLLAQRIDIHQHAALLHAGQHRHQRNLQITIDGDGARFCRQLWPDRLMQAQGDVGVFRRVARCHANVDLRERNLPGALPGDVLVVDGLVAEVLLCQRVHVVPRCGGVQHVGFKHGVVADTLQADAGTCQHVHVVFCMLAELGLGGILEQGLQRREHARGVQLRWRPGVIVRKRNIGRCSGLHREGNTHDAGAHGIQGRCFRIECNQLRLLEPVHPGRKLRPFSERLVIPCRHRFPTCGLGCRQIADLGLACWRIAGRQRRLHALVEITQRGVEFVARVQRAQGFHVGGAQGQIFHAHVQFDVGLDGHQATRQWQLIQRLTQVFTDLAANRMGVVHDAIERSVLGDPLGRRLRSTLGYARHVVHGVTHQRQVVDDAFRRHAELRDHGFAVHGGVGHRVDQADARRHQLREILVPGRDGDIHAEGFRGTGQRADHIVRFHTRNAQYRKPERTDDGQHGFDLCFQLDRCWCAGGLVVGIHFISKGRARGITDEGDTFGMLLQGRAQHVDHAKQRAGRFARRVGQRRQGMEGPEQVRRAIDEYESRTIRRHGSAQGDGSAAWRAPGVNATFRDSNGKSRKSRADADICNRTAHAQCKIHKQSSLQNGSGG